MIANKHETTAAGRKVSILRAGPAAGTPALLVHGGRAGLTPIASGAHLWDRAMPLLAAGRPVVALDLPGCGGSDLGAADVLSVEKLGQHLVGVLDARRSMAFTSSGTISADISVCGLPSRRLAD